MKTAAAALQNTARSLMGVLLGCKAEAKLEQSVARKLAIEREWHIGRRNSNPKHRRAAVDNEPF
jgi:hypothetical protein